MEDPPQRGSLVAVVVFLAAMDFPKVKWLRALRTDPTSAG
jgi:hypothetical protein